MSAKFIHLPAIERREILNAVGVKLGQEAQILEKDIWLCWTLRTIFSIPDRPQIAFKGGTSLSKVYNVISRFSEDLDITIDYRSFGEKIDPFAEGVSKSQIKKLSEALKAQVKKYANESMLPHIRAQLREFPQEKSFRSEISDNGEIIWLYYPSVVDGGDAGYIENQILIELGGRNVTEPSEKHLVEADIAEIATGLDFPSAEVTVLSPERTYWEKATLIHVECNRSVLKANTSRLSRHWYDMYILAEHEIGKKAINNRSLLADVIKHKRVFFNSKNANYDHCLENKLKLIPGNELMVELQKDYKKMVAAGMIYGSPPSFNDIIARLSDIEGEINA